MTSMHKNKMPFGARDAALKVLGAFRRDNAWPDFALGGVVERFGLSERDAALASRIANGVLQNLALCDFYAGHYSSISLRRIEPLVLDIIRISIYQIVFLTKIPHSAAVNEGVALAKRHSNPRAAGFVNALLRKVSGAALGGGLPEVSGTELHRLSIGFSHPEWLVREFCGVLGIDGVRSLLAANNAADTPVTAQVNTLRVSTDEVLSELLGDGVDAVRHEWLDGCVELRGAGDISRLGAFAKGHFYIQDVSSRLAVLAAAPSCGDLVVDGCAAPGGKSFAAAVLMGNSGRVMAFDVHASRLRLVEEGAGRLGIGVVDCFHRDMSVVPCADMYGVGGADVVFADVPCSGFGVIRKKPEIRFKPEGDVVGLPDVQRRILSSLSAFVRPGGILLYSTCTLLRRENEDVVEWFLRDNGLFQTEGFVLPGVGEVPEGMLTLWPHIHGTDGFFICKLRKRG